jgi:hypothetical protein
MRIQVRIPPHTWEQACRLARMEHRPLKNQIELLLWKAIDQAAETQGLQPQPICTGADGICQAALEQAFTGAKEQSWSRPSPGRKSSPVLQWHKGHS